MVYRQEATEGWLGWGQAAGKPEDPNTRGGLDRQCGGGVHAAVSTVWGLSVPCAGPASYERQKTHAHRRQPFHTVDLVTAPGSKWTTEC
jgi:hypothetical protein